eukprot:316615-Prymnesium_polylepis.2
MLVPHRMLHLVPLHALPLRGMALIDQFIVAYTPSLRVLHLQSMQQRSENVGDRNNLMVVNPTEDLSFADVEGEWLTEHLGRAGTTVLAHNTATRDRVINHLQAGGLDAVHFTCHGHFDVKTPLSSCLLLHGCPMTGEPRRPCGAPKDTVLSLDDLLSIDSLRGCRLAVLSACQTGVVEREDLTDEYVGLPAGFLHAGCATVVASLWAVDDLSTALMMRRFYEIVAETHGDHQVALRGAMLWLRNLRAEEVSELCAKGRQRGLASLAADQEGQEHEDSAPRPFESPAFWAAFLCIKGAA